MLKEGFNTRLRLPKRGRGGLEMMSQIPFCGRQQKDKRQQASLAAREILIRYQEKLHTCSPQGWFSTCHRFPEQLRNLHPGRHQDSPEQGPELPELVLGRALLWAGGGTKQSRGQNSKGRAEGKVTHRGFFALVLPKPLSTATCRFNHQIHNKFCIHWQGVPLPSYRNTPSFDLLITFSLPLFC